MSNRRDQGNEAVFLRYCKDEAEKRGLRGSEVELKPELEFERDGVYAVDKAAEGVRQKYTGELFSL